MILKVNVGSLDHLLKAAGITVDQLAEAFDCTGALVRKKLKGKRSIYTRELDLIHEKLQEQGSPISRRALETLVGADRVKSLPFQAKYAERLQQL